MGKERHMSEPAYRLIHPQANRSFVFKWEPFDLTTRWHYHPEIELIYFIRGCTGGVIGEGFHQFNEGELVILGGNFPHVLQEDKEYARQYPDERPFGLIIQFTEDFLGKDFLQKPELFLISQLLRKSRRGISFHRDAVVKVSRTLLSMHAMDETRKLFALLEVLMQLSETDHHQYLTAKDYSYDHTQDEERMRAVNEYVYQNFAEKISIRDIAGIANMTESSFCRYFKSRTLKTFTRFLNEVRISYSCKLLNNDGCLVTDACFASGFTNLSYFNRQFKAVTKMSPLGYKKWKRGATANVGHD
jgi:AraC-like DNA-binding protein